MTKKWGAIVGAAAFFNFAGMTMIADVPGFEVATAVAQEDEEQPRKKNTVSSSVGKRLTEAFDAYGNEDYATALTVLERLRGQNLSPYERATVMEFLGNVYYNLDRPNDALTAWRAAYDLNEFPQDRQLRLQLLIAQSYVIQERYSEASSLLQDYINRTPAEEIPSGVYFMMARVYYASNNYTRSLSFAETGVTRARAEGKPVRQGWTLTSALYLQLERWRDAQRLLREMIGLWPGYKSYWAQLAATYSQLNDDETAYYLGIMSHYQGWSTQSSDYERLASYSLSYDVPYRGVRFLEEGFSRDIVDKEKSTYQLLASAYMESREWEKSIEPLRQAAERSDDGKLWLFLCQSYNRDRKYKSAERACRNAINKRGLRNTGDAWLQLGNAQLLDERQDDALKSFEEAEKYEASARNARASIRYIESLRAREEQQKKLEEEIRQREEEENRRLSRE